MLSARFIEDMSHPPTTMSLGWTIGSMAEKGHMNVGDSQQEY